MKIGMIFAAGALALAGVALTPAPAQARTFVSIGLGSPGYYGGGYYGRPYREYYGYNGYGGYSGYYGRPYAYYDRGYYNRGYYDRGYYGPEYRYRHRGYRHRYGRRW